MSKVVKIGNKVIGGGNPVLIQSMTNTKTEDSESTIEQIKRLETAGCDIVRFSVYNSDCVKSIEKIKENTNIPLVADIHFDYKLALDSAYAGIDKIRINPGNIGDEENVKKVVQVCKEKNIPIRIGVNGGSLEKEILNKYGSPTPEALVESAFKHINILHKFDFDNIVVSIKSSNVVNMINAYSLFAEKSDIPLHLGVTETGNFNSGLVKSAVGIGNLLLKGVGDTMRVSLTADPVEEVYAAKDILKACGLRKDGIEIVSCPTCGRCNIDLINTVNEVYGRLKNCDKNIKIAIMGCIVNGPGEAREADIGIAGGKDEGILFKKGEIVSKIPGDKLVECLIDEINKM